MSWNYWCNCRKLFAVQSLQTMNFQGQKNSKIVPKITANDTKVCDYRNIVLKILNHILFRFFFLWGFLAWNGCNFYSISSWFARIKLPFNNLERWSGKLKLHVDDMLTFSPSLVLIIWFSSFESQKSSKVCQNLAKIIWLSNHAAIFNFFILTSIVF